MINWSGAKALKFLIKKGEALEQWQEQLSNLKVLGGKTLDDSKTLEETERLKAHKMKSVIEANQGMSGELRGIFKNGQEVRGVEPHGWGSLAHIKVDNETGEIVDAERVTTPEDSMFAVHYIWFLEKEFARMDREEHRNDYEVKNNGSSRENEADDEFHVIEDHFTKLFFDPENKEMIEIIDKRLNLTQQYHGDLSGKSIMEFIRAKRTGDEEQ